MKKSFYLLAMTLLCGLAVTAQNKKIFLTEDAFVQGGAETADLPLGKTKSNVLLVFNSKANTKYARIIYFKFIMNEKLKEDAKIELFFYMKVYKNEEEIFSPFKLDVMGVTNDQWSELTVTWNTKPEQGVRLGGREVEQSFTEEEDFYSVVLDTKEFNKLYTPGKDNVVTLALANNDFAKVSARVTSKEGGHNTTGYLLIN